MTAPAAPPSTTQPSSPPPGWVPPAGLQLAAGGTARPRLSTPIKLVIFVAGFVAVVLIANVVVAGLSPGAAAGCPTGQICQPPPPAAQLTDGKIFTNTKLGYSFEYNGDWFALKDEGDRGVFLEMQKSYQGAKTSGEIWISAAPASQQSPEQLLDERLSDYKKIMDLQADTDSNTTIHGPAIGQLVGVGGSYVGTFDTDQTPGTLAVIAAGDSRISVAFAFLIGMGESSKCSLRSTTDDTECWVKDYRAKAAAILKTFRWTAGP